MCHYFFDTCLYSFSSKLVSPVIRSLLKITEIKDKGLSAKGINGKA